MKSLIKKTQKKQITNKKAQCCAKLSKTTVGCHD